MVLRIAMNLACMRDAPFVICPCCTTKLLTKREDSSNSHNAASYGMNVLFRWSGATNDIAYPRSKWLSKVINPDAGEDEYAILAKVADVGLSPQTPSE